MDEAFPLEEQLRTLFLNTPDSLATRVATIAVSVAIFAIVLYLVRRRRLREEYTPIWIAVAVALMLLSTSNAVLHGVTRALGAWTPSSAVFFLGEVFLVALCLNFAVRLSAANLQLKNLAQEVAILRAGLERVSRGQRAEG